MRTSRGVIFIGIGLVLLAGCARDGDDADGANEVEIVDETQAGLTFSWSGCSITPLTPALYAKCGARARASFSCTPNAYLDRKLHIWLKRNSSDDPLGVTEYTTCKNKSESISGTLLSNCGSGLGGPYTWRTGTQIFDWITGAAGECTSFAGTESAAYYSTGTINY